MHGSNPTAGADTIRPQILIAVKQPHRTPWLHLWGELSSAARLRGHTLSAAARYLSRRERQTA